jgi:hypothetical protein
LRENYSQSNTEVSDEEALFLRQSRIDEIALKQNFSIAPLSKYLINAGFEINGYQFQPSNFAFSSSDFDTDSLLKSSTVYRPNALAIYVENKLSPLKWWDMNVGMRLSTFNGGKFRFLEPRLSTTFRYKSTSFNLAYARTAQFIHLLSNNSLGLQSDLWTPSVGKIQPQTAHQYSAEMIHFNKRLQLEGSLGFYYKSLQNQIDYRQGINFFSPKNLDWQNQIEIGGIGRAYGMEVLLKKENKRLSGWISYTLSWNERKFEKINSGKWYPFKYDRRHNFNFTGLFNINDSWKFSTNFIFQNGTRLTLPSGYARTAVNYNPFSSTVAQSIVDSRNNQQLPNYHRMDISFTKLLAKKKKRDRELSFGAYNIYARKNPYLISLNNSYDGQSGTYTYAVSTRSLLVFVPSIAYKFTW